MSVIAQVDELQLVITDTSAPRETLDALEERGVQVMMVKPLKPDKVLHFNS